MKGVAIGKNFGTNRQNTLNSPRKEQNSLLLEGACKLRIASIVCELTSRYPSLMTWPRPFKQLGKNSHFLNFSVTPVSFNSVRAC